MTYTITLNQCIDRT